MKRNRKIQIVPKGRDTNRCKTQDNSDGGIITQRHKEAIISISQLEIKGMIKVLGREIETGAK